jgi:fibronectin type 3 domain-containing protein
VQALEVSEPETGHGTKGSEPQPSASEPRGARDLTARAGQDYRYTAVRTRTVVLGGHSLMLTGETSAPVSIAYRDVFPPAAPTGLAAAPELGELPAIGLSWEPGPEADLAGYRVYRAAQSRSNEPRTVEALFTCLAGCGTQPLVSATTYRDPSVQSGEFYRYRVTAVDRNGNESVPSAAITERVEPPN